MFWVFLGGFGDCGGCEGLGFRRLLGGWGAARRVLGLRGFKGLRDSCC